MTTEPNSNPIDATKVATDPALLPYAHTIGSFVIKPTERGKIKGNAMAAMYQQTNKQLQQVYEQMKALAEQARRIQKRIEISTQIYEAEMNFEPVVGHTYYLYLRKNGKYVLSMIAPEEWGKNPPYEYISTAILLADHTWDVLAWNENSFSQS
ncbi:MAG: DUF2452 domain-containing protein [Microscillaceae bacterium]|nr:DUF2452 domain-containing protein [Microscillaceae bacterium]MDW8461908.1 DUF2452 domain-containing protein [Cytophagales bacterium]